MPGGTDSVSQSPRVALERVLVVEDDASIRAVLSDILACEGYLVDQAANGREALLKLQRARPDVILLDLMMPIVDGPTFVKTCWSLDHAAGIPIVLVSASPNLAQLAEQLRSYGVRGALTKPFDLNELLTMIEQVSKTSTYSVG